MTKQAKIIIFTCLYITGILSVFYTPMFILGIISIFSFRVFHKIKKSISTKLLIALISIFFIGILNTNLHLKYNDDLTTYTNNDVILTAKITSIPTNNIENKTKFYAKAINIQIDDYEKSNLSAKTLVTINDSQTKLNTIKIGDTIKLKGKLKKPEKATNPSQFDYATYLQNKDTFSLLYVNEDWEIISRATDFNGKLISKLNDTRNSIIQIHKQNIKSPNIEVLGGMIFGDDAVNPDEEIKNSFIKSGIFHILAASGMNVTLIFGIWFFFARTIKMNYKFSILAGIFLIFVYTCMTGFGAPIIRAFLMLTLILIGKLIDKDTATISLLFIVGFLMLIFNPLMTFDIGFQLSFLVTFALIITAPLIKFENKIISCTLGACLIPIIAQIYAAPLQMFYFNSFSLYSIFANIAIIPVLSIVSFLGFISSFLALIPLWAKEICFLADIILNPLLIYIVKVADFFANLPHAIIETPKPSIIQLILYFTIILLLTYKLNKKIIAVLTILLAITFIPNLQKYSEIIFFSVGNADATLIKSPQNKYYLIDTGKLPYKESSSQADFIIVKYLKDNGIKEIDGLILTHFDSDHAGGTIDLLEKIKINNIYISNSYENTLLSSDILSFIKNNNLPSITINKETVIAKENDFEIKAIKPNNDLLKSENDKSIITSLNTFNNKILFMADGSINTYNALPEDFKTNVKIIKSAHHGAKDTINENIIKNSDIFIISTGQNIYGHPHTETINQLKTNNKTYYRTDYHNAIKVKIDNKSSKIKFYSPIKKSFLNK